jgi:hypothetical protein
MSLLARLGYEAARFVKETKPTVRALIDSPTFTAKHQGQSTEFYEFAINNSGLMAKVSHYPTQFNRRELYVHRHEGKQFGPVVFGIGQLATASLPRGPENYLQPDETITLDLTTPDTAIQFDGEYRFLPEGSRLTIRQAGAPIQALSNRL